MGSAEKICRSRVIVSRSLWSKEGAEEATYSSFYDLSGLELLLGVLETNVGVVHWPNDTIDVSRDIEEHSRVVESLDGSL